MSETAPTGPTASPTPTAPAGGQFFEAKVSELARFLKLVMGKGGSGNPPFPAVDLAYIPAQYGSPSFLRSEHRDKASKFSVKAEWAGVGEGSAFECAVNPVSYLLDYVDGSLFPSDSSVRVSLDEASAKIRIAGGNRTASMSATALSEIPRPAAPGVKGSPYLTGGPLGASILSDPAKAPAATVTDSPREAWSAWTGKGYSVAMLPVKEAATLLSAGSTLVSHKLAGTLVTFLFDGGEFSVVCHDPKKADADAIQLADLHAKTVEGSANDGYSVLYANLEPFLGSLALLKTEDVAIVHHPAEMRANIVATELVEGRPVLRFTQTVMLHADPSTKKKA